MFKNDFFVEWKRLNPRLAERGNGLKASFVQGFYEGWHGYFAPLRMAWWIFKWVLVRLVNRLMRKQP